MKKRWVLVLGIFGALLTAQSILWEYGRMHPNYGFIVEPWSIRGFETVHGSVGTATGILALLAVLAVAWKGSEELRYGIPITLGIGVGATAIAAVFSGDDHTLTPGFPVIALLTLILTIVLYRVFTSLRKTSIFVTNFWLRSLVMIVLLGVTGFVVNAAIGGKRITLPVWVMIGIIFLLLAALSISPEPRELAANRMLMFSSIAGAAALALSAGAVRSTLIRLQRETIGVAAQYKDTQVTSGHLMATIGLVFVFFAAVALWARRRDAILTAQRVRRQREAAEASAAEIAAAIEEAGISR